MVLLRESSTLFRRVSEDTLHSMRGFGPLLDEEAILSGLAEVRAVCAASGSASSQVDEDRLTSKL